VKQPGGTGAQRIPASVWLLASTAFLAPVIGGNLNVEAAQLAPGIWPLLTSLFDGVDTPGLADLVVALGALLCVIGLAMRRRVLQLPSNHVAGGVLALVGIITASILVSSFKNVSVAAWSHWLAYALVFFAAASAVGRVRGPVVVLGAFVGGCTLSSVLAIREWGLNRAVDPSWRVFAIWNNPNALAGILVLGLVVSLALLVTTDSRPSLAFGLCSIAIGFALFLTQSRGGLLASAVGVAVLLIAVASTRQAGRAIAITRLGATLGILVALVALVALSNRAGQAGLGSRLAVSSSATSQSTAFRMNLWRGAIGSLSKHPVGTGIGTYAFYSAESGLTTETQLAHNTPLQMAVEASVLAPLALAAVVILWIFTVLRGTRPEPNAAIVRASLVAAILAACVDAMFESNLYYFGTGVAVFLLLGLGLQLAADAVAPEFSPPVMRRSLTVGAAAILAFLAIFAFREVVKSNARYDHASNPNPDFGTLKAIADGDGEAHYLIGLYDGTLSTEGRVAEFKLAVQLEPSSKHFKLLADAYAHSNNPTGADAAYRDALSLDPNNLDLLTRLLKFDQGSGHPDDAIATARRLVEIESKPYFRIRALSEIVPLQTADARVFLASQGTDKRDVARQLMAATRLYREFERTSVPYLRKSWHDFPTDLPMAGETQAGVVEKLQTGASVAKSAEIAARNVGLTADAIEAAAAGRELQGALDEFTRALAGNK